METISLPKYEAAPLDNIAKGLHGVRILFVNVFAVSDDEGGWTLIDAGLPLSSSHIRGWVDKIYGENARPRAIIQTHGHFDHTGALKDLAEHWDVPVYAHQLELPFLTGKQQYPPPDPTVGGGIMPVISPLFPRGPIDLGSRVQALPADGSVPGLPEWKWLHTPGHTVGHVSFFRQSDKALLVGDAFCTTNQQSFLSVAQQKPEMSGPPAYYTPDWDAAQDSVERLAALNPNIVAPGHGLPMTGPETTEALRRLARNFRQLAVPHTSHAE